jgi:hypothetical protein
MSWTSNFAGQTNGMANAHLMLENKRLTDEEAERRRATEDEILSDAQRYQDAQGQVRDVPQADYGQSQQDYALSLQSREQQSALGDSYWDAIRGTGPSVAQQQLLQGRDMTISNANAMAASARGGVNQAAARRQAMGIGGDAMQQAAQQAAMVRAQEVADARSGLSGLLGTQRGQDLGQRGQSQQQAQADQQAALASRSMDDALTQGYLGAETSATQAAYGGQTDKYAADQGVAQASADRAQRASEASSARTDRYIGAAVAAGGAALAASDRRVKTDISAMSPEELDDFLESLQAHQYKYKQDSGFDDGKEHVGVMAQDLENTALGPDVVHGDDPKMIDAPPGVIYALLSRISDRLGALEGSNRG